MKATGEHGESAGTTDDLRLPPMRGPTGQTAYLRSPGLRPAQPHVVAETLASLSAINPYFAISTDLAKEADPAWRPLTALYADSRALRAMTADVARRLATRETRVAASILFQGLASRLWSPVIGAVVSHDLLPDLAPAHVHWRPTGGGPLPLWTARPTGWEIRDPGLVAEPIYRNVVSELLEPLAQTVQEIIGIAPRLLWGNVASALAGTLRTIVRERPDLEPRATPLSRELLSIGVLEGTGDLAEPAPGHPFFVRRSCCLYYRLPGGGKCGDCVLLAPEVHRAEWARAIRREQ